MPGVPRPYVHELDLPVLQRPVAGRARGYLHAVWRGPSGTGFVRSRCRSVRKSGSARSPSATLPGGTRIVVGRLDGSRRVLGRVGNMEVVAIPALADDARARRPTRRR